MLRKIADGSIKVALVGLGYVGLPLAVAFGKKFDTVGFDINKNRLKMLENGEDATLETSSEDLKSAKFLKYTSDPALLGDRDVIIVSVPTPVDRFNNPDLTPLYRSSETVGKVMKKGAIVVFESTVYPGCTEEECVPVLEKFSGMKFNTDFFCGYSPERINPGDKEHTLTKIKKITSGSTSDVSKNETGGTITTSSGKTSVLNALSSFIGEDERVLVIEDASELQLQQRHVVCFETRKADKNGQGEVTIRDLIHSSLRLRPDRLVIGEIRGGEALDLLQALNTGHAGSMSTIHANTPLDCLYRLETCALLSGVEIPLTALRSQVASAIDAVVHTARLADGSRKLMAISEVLPLQNGEYRTSDLLVWQTERILRGEDGQTKVEGRHVLKNSPSFAEQAAMNGLELPGY